VYELTPEGDVALARWAESLKDVNAHLLQFRPPHNQLCCEG
jgi:DNA-binding PadR family transcriptional regulator